MITCIFERGEKAFLRHIGVTALVVQNYRILLVKRTAHISHANKYSLPGGFVEHDERLKDAVVRELYEETGYRAKQVALFLINDSMDNNNEDRQNLDCIFMVSIGEKAGKPDHEVKAVEWRQLDDLPPDGEFAFDHGSIIHRYQQHLKNPGILPIMDYVYKS